MYDENWWRKLKVGDVVCDCRYRHLRIKKIEDCDNVKIPYWLFKIYGNDLVPITIFEYIDSKICGLFRKLQKIEVVDRDLILEDGSQCSATHCCNSGDHEWSHKKQFTEEQWVEFKQDFIDRAQAQIDNPARMTEDQFRMLFTEGRLLLEETDSELEDILYLSESEIADWMSCVSCPAPLNRATYLIELLSLVKPRVACCPAFTIVTFQDTKRELDEIEARLAKEFGISKEDVRAEIKSREKSQTLGHSENVQQWQQTYASYLDWLAND